MSSVAVMADVLLASDAFQARSDCRFLDFFEFIQHLLDGAVSSLEDMLEGSGDVHHGGS